MYCRTAVLQNNSQCLLMQQEIFFSLSEMKTQKNEHAGMKREFEEKVRERV